MESAREKQDAMTSSFKEFEDPFGLEDAAAAPSLQELTSGPIHQKIDTVCNQPDCPNNPLAQENRDLFPEPRRRGRQPEQIFRTNPKISCIL